MLSALSFTGRKAVSWVSFLESQTVRFGADVFFESYGGAVRLGVGYIF